MQIVPVTNAPYQEFTISLNNVFVDILVKYNSRSKIFNLDIRNTTTQEYYIYGLPLVLGAELINKYGFDFEGGLIMYDFSGQSNEATLDNLGVTVFLLYLTDEEVHKVKNSVGFN